MKMFHVTHREVMMLSLLTVEGLYNYDNTLFDGFNVPYGLVKQIAIDVILMRTRELELSLIHI